MDVRSELRDTVQAPVQAGKSILAADESKAMEAATSAFGS
jgi:hypothetical protein